MGISNELLADFGLRLARVDLVLGCQEYRLGDEIKGKLIVHSGSVDQRIDVIYLHLKMDAKQGTEHIVRVINSVQISDGFSVQSDSPQTEHSFTFRLPYYIPVTANHVNYRLTISINKKSVVHPHNFAPIKILPSVEIEAVLKGLEKLDFLRMNYSGEMDHDHQNFVFYPTKFMQGKFAELELMFYQNNV